MPEGGLGPERTCIGCRSRAPKAELVRLTRSAGAEIALDPSGRAPGRGAYVHPTEACIARAARSQAIARALRAPLGQVEAGRLIAELTSMTEAKA
ncbi:MAG: YlxR family protein [Actinobacteria bacterium]|nr:MAG: YlxR family protein [Actinomycetota bacterium]